MPLSPSMWDDLVPPEVWVTVSTIDREEADHVLLTVRIRERGRRSISASAEVTRYAPTGSILLACSKCLDSLATAQVALKASLLEEVLLGAVAAWVDPF